MNAKWISVGIIAGAAIAATVAVQVQPEITQFADDGTLTWSGGYPGGSGTVMSNTNLQDGAWTAETNVPTPTALTSVQLALQGTGTAFYKVTAESPEGTELVPSGMFQMGDASATADLDERPAHSLYVSDFYMGKFEVTRLQYQAVKAFAEAYLDYQFENPGIGTATNHPVEAVNWYDALKYCNAASEILEFDPCYYTDVAHTTVYKDNSHPDLSSAHVDWNANGYRLPTEAEWEKAARGGLTGHYYPWASLFGDGYLPFMDGRKANFLGSGDPFETGSTPIGYYDGAQTPAGCDMANGYGLYDMAGNVGEWCWDRLGEDWYAAPAAAAPDTRGPDTGDRRIVRGGGYMDSPLYLRCSMRVHVDPVEMGSGFGFRCAKGTGL